MCIDFLALLKQVKMKLLVPEVRSHSDCAVCSQFIEFYVKWNERGLGPISIVIIFVDECDVGIFLHFCSCIQQVHSFAFMAMEMSSYIYLI
jgi:hypothetical protein